MDAEDQLQHEVEQNAPALLIQHQLSRGDTRQRQAELNKAHDAQIGERATEDHPSLRRSRVIENDAQRDSEVEGGGSASETEHCSKSHQENHWSLVHSKDRKKRGGAWTRCGGSTQPKRGAASLPPGAVFKADLGLRLNLNTLISDTILGWVRVLVV
jgi:hypothetical protein